MNILMTITGLAGAALITTMYWLLQRGSMGADDVKFYAANGIGAFLIAASLAYDFDFADLGGIVVEIAWMAVSIMGILKVIRTKTV